MRRKIDWSAHFINQAKSGLDVKTYCRKYGLGISSYYGNKKKLGTAKVSNFVDVVIDEKPRAKQLKFELIVDGEGTCSVKGNLEALLRLLRGMA